MVPSFDPQLSEDGRLQLPPGIHEATWQELAARFGTNEKRREILHGPLRALQALKAAGCAKAFVDGSFDLETIP